MNVLQPAPVDPFAAKRAAMREEFFGKLFLLGGFIFSGFAQASGTIHYIQPKRARFFLGLAAEQDGRPADAASIWRDLIAKAPSGVLLYLPQEGRGIGLMNKLRAYQLQDQGLDTVEANEALGFASDAREYEFPAEILKALGAKRIRLLSNNPEKVRQLEESGIQVVERVPCQPRVSKISRKYLETKKSKMGHLLKGL